MNRAKQKGDQFERDVVKYLQTDFPDAQRRIDLGRRLDRGDIIGVGEWVLECKNHATIDLAAFVDQAAQEARNAGRWRFAAVIKRRRRKTGDAYVVMPLHVFRSLAFFEWLAPRLAPDE